MTNPLRSAGHAFAGLTTRGRCLIAAGAAAALCSWLLNERELLRVATFVALLPLLVTVMLAVSGSRLTVQRELRPARLPAGGECTVELTVQRGRTGLPSGPLVFTEALPAAVGAAPRFVVDRVPRRHPARLRYTACPQMRGFHRIGPLCVSTTDPFGLCELDRELAGTAELVVEPRTVALSGRPREAGAAGTRRALSRSRASGIGEPDTTIRPYRQGDDLRRVHWASTARRDELMVRLEHQPPAPSTTVLLDHRRGAHEASQSLEWAVSFAASVCLHLHRSGQPVRLVNGSGRVLASLGRLGSPAGGASPERSLLETLTGLEAEPEAPASAGDTGWPEHTSGGDTLIAVLGRVGDSDATRLARSRPAGAASFAVLLDATGDGPDGNEEPERNHASSGGDEASPNAAPARALRSGGWSVVLAGGRTPIDSTWTRLCQATVGAA